MWNLTMNGKAISHSAVPSKLAERLSSIPKAAVAFSGGVDSSYLLFAARACGVDVRAYYVSSQFQPQFELEDAWQLSGDLGVNMTIIPVDVLSNETVVANPADRCYHCKRLILESIIKNAAEDGYYTLMDGSNASDDASDRPGMRALSELKVASPLREAGVTKNQVREFSRAANLFTWDKPAYACLSTRVPTGVALTSELLDKIENAEDTLSKMGFSDFRARIIGTAVKLQLPTEQIPLAVKRHGELFKTLSVWFSDVYLDLKPR